MSTDLGTLLKLEVPVIVRIARRNLPVDEIMSWVPGMIIDLNKDADDELELMVNNVAIGTGTAAKIGENFGIRMTFVGDLRSRIEALQSRSQSLAENFVSADSAVASAAPGTIPEAEAVVENVISNEDW